VIVDDVEDHLNLGIVKARHHLFEFREREIRDMGVVTSRREERIGVVAPVIYQALVE
jgi:hypothetical protein